MVNIKIITLNFFLVNLIYFLWFFFLLFILLILVVIKFMFFLLFDFLSNSLILGFNFNFILLNLIFWWHLLLLFFFFLFFVKRNVWRPKNVFLRSFLSLSFLLCRILETGFPFFLYDQGICFLEIRLINWFLAIYHYLSWLLMGAAERLSCLQLLFFLWLKIWFGGRFDWNEILFRLIHWVACCWCCHCVCDFCFCEHGFYVVLHFLFTLFPYFYLIFTKLLTKFFLANIWNDCSLCCFYDY